MRILILTDSLGAPRSDIDVEKSWTYRIIDKYSRNHIIYTSLTRGLSSNSINFDLVKDFKPDIVICQLGIVDATRRAINQRLLRVIKLVPGVRTIVHKILKKYHYRFTKLFNVHFADPKRFEKNLVRLHEITRNILWIPIAPASTEMKRKVYNMSEDIDTYNEIIAKVFGNDAILQPYVDVMEIDDIFLSDGHHLNEQGNDLVFACLDAYMESNMRGDK